MQTTTSLVGYPQNDRTESESYDGAYTFKWIIDENLVEVHTGTRNLLELILSPSNLNDAYRQVLRNNGCGGVDKMGTSELLPYLILHKDELISMLLSGKYRPSPVRRVEIPKESGKKRLLGIPTVVDRFIQQAISQVLVGIYDAGFSDNSFGFRPNRSAHDALKRVQEYSEQGYRYCVNLDLERFFDTVHHSKLIEILSRTIKDGRVISLIHHYLNAGVMVNHRFEDTTEGVPQGGPLSPILSNILLNELDKELELRGHPFVRYADDCLILVKSLRATTRVRDSISSFIEKKLFLKVNLEKSVMGSLSGKKYLGYSFYLRGKPRICLCVHRHNLEKFKRTLKHITCRSNGKGYEWLKYRLTSYIRGWISYYRMADMKTFIEKTHGWLQRRIRMYIWKCWKEIKTRYANLQRCGIDKCLAWQWANTRKGYWRIASSWILTRSITNAKLAKAGYPSMVAIYSRMHRN